MSMMFAAVKAFKCLYCGKLFRTTRHDCKFDPAKTNCFTCKHYAGFNEPEFVDDYHKDVCVNCNADGNALFLNELKSSGYKLNCDEYELDERPLEKRKRGWAP